MEAYQSALQNDGKLLSSESNTKLCEFSSDEDVKSNLLALESLPEEILIEIFDFLPLEDVLNVTLVSKNLNAIISKSSKLLNKIEFKFNQWTCKDDWSGSRKYPNVQIKCEDANELIKVDLLKFDKTSVKVLTLDFDWIYLHELRKFLLEFENLEELCMIFMDFDELKFFEILPLPKRNLRSLKFSTIKCKVIDPIMILFTDWQVNRLTMDNFVNLSENLNVFKFLMNQNNLEDLSVNCTDFNQLDDAKFKLKYLKVQYLSENVMNSYGKFLQKHERSIIDLYTDGINDEYAENLNKFTKLKQLTVWRGGISKKLKLSTIENLSLHKCDCKGSFPFVKELYLYNSKLITLEDMKYLYKLIISCMRVDEISISTVKVLTLYDVYSQTRPFKFETSNLDELEIRTPNNPQDPQQWIIEYLDRAETQLKKLKIINCLIKPELVPAIKRNCSKIKCFDTVNCREESEISDWGVESDFLTLKEFMNK